MVGFVSRQTYFGIEFSLARTKKLINIIIITLKWKVIASSLIQSFGKVQNFIGLKKKEEKAYFLTELKLKPKWIKVLVADGTTLRARLQGWVGH